MTALNRKLARDLARMWGQLLAVALVMACGIATYVMSQSSVESVARAQQAYYERYRFPDVFVHLKRAPEALRARLEGIPGVQRVRTRVAMDVNLDVPGLAEPAVGRLISVPDRPPYGVSELHLRRGRFPEPGRAGEVVASEAFAEAHGMAPGDGLHAVINGRYEALTVVGIALSPEFVYQVRPGDIIPDDKRYGVLWMLDAELAPAFDLDGAFNDAVLTLMPGASEADVLARVDDLAAPYGGLGAYGRDDQTSHRYVSDEIKQLRSMAMLPPAIFLSVAAFVLNIVFSRLVQTQREQIAALKAFGYSRGAVGWHYLRMVLVVGVAGSALGVAAGAYLGSGLTAMYARFFRFPDFSFVLDTPAVVIALGAGAAAAAAGALGAVRRAAALPPAEAMRPEAPADYRATLLERSGVERLLTPGARMIVRHLERQPVRAAVSCVGIAAAVAVLILGSFTEDAVDYLIDFEFFHTQRQDMTVTLTEASSAGATSALSGLPGVMASEPFRAVAVRLRFGAREHRTAILGVPPAPNLNRVVDARERPVTLPAQGLVISDGLAELLGVGAGDTVTAEVLEGRRPTVRVPVSGVISAFIGSTAYMEISALNRLMREGGAVSGAYVDVDPAETDRLYTTLKQTPGVASVTLKRAALDAFRDTIAHNILLVRLFNIGFASVIAFGVVYNSARIALAERAHELASLRVLGFTRREISVILLGELAVLTVAAIPLGLVMGRGLAWLAALGLRTETHRIPLVVDVSTYAFAVCVVGAAALFSGLVVRRSLDRLDLIGVLKTGG